MSDRPYLTICMTCRAGAPLPADGVPPGQHLHARLKTLLGDPKAAPVVLHGVTCLAACERGCTAAISSPGKWSYLLGHLNLDLAADLLAYAQTYADSVSGAILPSRRAASLRHVVLGRMPAQDHAG